MKHAAAKPRPSEPPPSEYSRPSAVQATAERGSSCSERCSAYSRASVEVAAQPSADHSSADAGASRSPPVSIVTDQLAHQGCRCARAQLRRVYCHAKQKRPLDKLISSSRYWCLSRVRRCSGSKSTKSRFFWVLSCRFSVLPCSWLQYNLRTWSPTCGEQSCHVPDL